MPENEKREKEIEKSFDEFFRTHNIFPNRNQQNYDTKEKKLIENTKSICKDLDRI